MTTNLDHEVAGRVDDEPVSRSEQDGGRAFLNHCRAGYPRARAQAGPFPHFGLDPAVPVVPDAARRRRRLPGRRILQARRSRLGCTSFSSGSDAQRRRHDVPIGLHVTVEAFVLGFEAAACRDGIERTGCQRHTYGPELAAVMKIDSALEHNLFGLETFGPHGCDRLLDEPRELSVDAVRGDFVEVT